jgi:hypothetical protein
VGGSAGQWAAVIAPVVLAANAPPPAAVTATAPAAQTMASMARADDRMSLPFPD